MKSVSRRALLIAAPAAALLARVVPLEATTQDAPAPASFPSHPLELVREMVGASHGNIARVRELVAERPALARAAWDWGYGDWETALGAASHVGHRDIAELLIANGAHPTIFSAAMLGHFETVKAFVTATPGAQKIRGPHGITLLQHARAGGARAASVVAYLESVGDADRGYPNESVEVGDLTGVYLFGAAATDRLTVALNARGALTIVREGASERPLFHHGGRVFNPAGAEAVRVRFLPATGRATSIAIEDGPVRVSAQRQS